ncbi:Hpt domain protein [Leptospira ryugenii]|uniref:Hpt domain protein n=1 Tax=Leptospira ryugenii TaxID=1917863 RepID=A0A2P2E492_9LEPT|nr:Hpt domain-containing protein [Leptospira ryugenii]GBF51691.1 Hpt domain protein [Leptospira ryugenii]
MLIDWSRIESLVDTNDPDDLNWLKEMIASLLENMAVRIQNLGQFMEARSAKDLQSELHQIKGVAANFGLSALSALVIEAESKAKTGDIDTCISIATKIAPIWEETKLELQKRF